MQSASDRPFSRTASSWIRERSESQLQSFAAKQFPAPATRGILLETRATAMFFFSGNGFWLLVLGFGCLLATEQLVDKLQEEPGYYTAHGWPKAVGFAAATLAAIGLVFLTEKLAARNPEKPRKADDHTLFFLPLEFWVIILPLIGIGFWIWG
jgi:hypothetical protein